MKVMIVDDDKSILNALKRALSGAFEVVTFSSVDEAVRDIAAGTAYDAVLSDVCMGRTGGEEFREAVRGIDPALASRFVFMSGGPDVPSFAPFLASVRYLRKPFSAQDAVRALHEVIPE